MPEPFDYTSQPEFQGPISEPRSSGSGPALDVQALAQHQVRLPQLQPREPGGDLVPRSARSPYIDQDPEFIAAERLDAVRRHLAAQGSGREALRTLLDSAARGAGIDPAVARDLSDELSRLMPIGVVAVDEPPAQETPADELAADEPKEAAK